MSALTGKVAIIAGGTSGIGRATAELFAREGARVSVTGRGQVNLAAEAIGHGAQGVSGDVADLLRVSQINGSVSCIDLHARDARKTGEIERRLSTLVAWRDTPSSDSFFSDRERAALEWTEAVTLVAQTHVPDEVWNRVRPYFTPKISSTSRCWCRPFNTWNRFAISFRKTPV